MRSLGAVVLAAALAFPVAAVAGPQRRDPFGLELALGGGWSGSPASSGGALQDGGFGSLRVGAFAPYEDGLQGGVGALLGWGGGADKRLSGFLGARLLSGFDSWQSRVDVQLLVDTYPTWGVGVRLAFGGLLRVTSGVRLGAELGGLFVAGNVRGAADASLVLLYAW